MSVNNFEMPEMGAWPKKTVLTIIGAIVAILFLFKSVVTIDSGYAGVIYQPFSNGVDTKRTYGEGFHLIAPWNTMFKYEIRQQEVFEKLAVLSSNGLEIKLEASIWCQPQYEELGLLHQKRGQEYIERVIRPSVRSATRSVVGRYTPEQIYSSKRDAIQKEIFDETKKILDRQYLQLNDILIRDVTLPPTIKGAIERKLKQEQEALEYEFRLAKAKQEAIRQRIDAEGKAKANLILSASLTDKILKEKGIEATKELANSPNAKVVVIGSGKDGMPLILGGN
jgi:regulator of protease activity HflC (stomatin/prohibitin superfamily)